MPESPYFAKLLKILGTNKVVVISNEDIEVRVINGSIGSDQKRGAFVNVEIDFADGREAYRVYPFGVNRIITDRQRLVLGPATSRLGIHVNQESPLSIPEPKSRMDHDGIARVVYNFVRECQKSGETEKYNFVPREAL